MLRSLMVSVAVLGFSACMVGPSTRTFAPANWPDGIEADLRLKRSRIQGELLAVQDSALLVLRDDRVVLVLLAAIRVGSFSQRGVLVENGHALRGTLPRLRLVSRFPAGLTPELKARLLAAYGQTEPEVAP
jgi:hypothetical protein